MKELNVWCALAACAALALCSASAGAAVVGATVADASSGDYTLTSVSVTRGSAGLFTYTPNQLTGIELTDVAAFDVPIVVTRGAPLPAPGTRASLIQDLRLDTGVTNPVSDAAASDASFEVTFATPIVNSDGEDVLIFELGGGDATRFWVSGTDRDTQSIVLSSFATARLSGMPYTSFAYANGNDRDVNDLTELETSPATSYGTARHESAAVAAAGLDLSAFGIPLGGTVSALRFQADTGAARVDPLLIAGLPAVPEPAAMSLFGVGAMFLLVGRRRN